MLRTGAQFFPCATLRLPALSTSLAKPAKLAAAFPNTLLSIMFKILIKDAPHWSAILFTILRTRKRIFLHCFSPDLFPNSFVRHLPWITGCLCYPTRLAHGVGAAPQEMQSRARSLAAVVSACSGAERCACSLQPLVGPRLPACPTDALTPQQRLSRRRAGPGVRVPARGPARSAPLHHSSARRLRIPARGGVGVQLGAVQGRWRVCGVRRCGALTRRSPRLRVVAGLRG